MEKLKTKKLFLRGGSMLKFSRKFSKKKCAPYLLLKRRKKKQDKRKPFVIQGKKKCKTDHRYTRH
jgi:hypothetical protein